jgi:hypothetical protein
VFVNFNAFACSIMPGVIGESLRGDCRIRTEEEIETSSDAYVYKDTHGTAR